VETADAEEENDWRLFIGYTITDQHGTTLGMIDAVEDSTMNVLFIVSDGDKEHLIPATEDFIVAIDEKKKSLEMFIPEGLIEE
jgi:16S rRNA processing protein RimM